MNGIATMAEPPRKLAKASVSCVCVTPSKGPGFPVNFVSKKKMYRVSCVCITEHGSRFFSLVLGEALS